MDSGDFVRTRGEHWLSGRWRVLRRLFQSVLFYVLLLHLGAMTLTWNLVCLVLYRFLPREQGLVIGRAAISSI